MPVVQAMTRSSVYVRKDKRIILDRRENSSLSVNISTDSHSGVEPRKSDGLQRMGTHQKAPCDSIELASKITVS